MPITSGALVREIGHFVLTHGADSAEAHPPMSPQLINRASIDRKRGGLQWG